MEHEPEDFDDHTTNELALSYRLQAVEDENRRLEASNEALLQVVGTLSSMAQPGAACSKGVDPAVIEALAPVVQSLVFNIRKMMGGSGRDVPEPGRVDVSEAQLDGMLRRIEQADAELEDAEALLERVSVMLGYGGVVDDDFRRMLRARPSKPSPATAYLLPDGSMTNVLTEALAEWRMTDENAPVVRRAQAIANEAKGVAGKPADDGEG